MSADESNPLIRRVTDLESEVRSLRKRVAALEGVEFTEIVMPPLAPQPLAPVPMAPVPVGPPQVVVVPPAVPPPLPVAVRPAPGPAPLPPPVVARPVPPPAPPPPLEPARPSALHELLDALHLLPPSGPRAGEAGLGAWWATRIGSLILVIGVVFFGVYISLGTPPWVKLVELAVIAGGVTLGGLWLERRLDRLGSVVMGSGLALCFFTAFAAYAVPAVKVVESITAGVVLQGAAVLGIGAAALWRRSSTVATMAVLLGFVSAFFSFSEGFDDFAVVAGLGLSAMAVFFRRREGWAAPVVASAALVHLVDALVAIQIWDTQVGARSPWLMFGAVAVAWGVHFLSLVLEGAGEEGRIELVQRWVQAINTSLAVVAGLVVALVALPPGDRSWYFFGAGAVLVGAAAWAWRFVPRDGIFGMFAVKAASLIALGVIAEWDARTRWIALVVQAVVIMAAAVRTQRGSLAITSVLAWLVSLLFFGDDVHGLRGGLISGDGVAVVLYILGGAAFLAWVSSWMRAQERIRDAGTGVVWVLGLGAAVPVGLTLGITWQEPWIIVACVLLSLGLILIARIMRSLVPVIGSVLAMLAAHAIVQVFDESQWGLLWLWAGAGLVAVRSGALAWLVGLRAGENRDAWQAAAVGLGVLMLAAIGGATMQSIAVYPGLAVAVALAVASVAAGAVLGRADFVAAGWYGLPLAWALHVWHRPMLLEDLGGAGWLWFAAAGVPIALAIPVAVVAGHRGAAVARGLAAAVGVALVWAAAEQSFGVVGLAWSVVGAAALYLALGQWRECAVSKVAASALLALGAAHFLLRTGWASSVDAWPALAAVFVVIMGLALAPLVQARSGEWLRPELEKPWRIAHVAAATVGLFALATLGYAAWRSYGSVVWALGGVVLFVLGLVLRARSHRIAGLVALGLCIPRVFLYDIQSTKYRIAAFVVLGVLLLIVGFSYQKFRYLVEGTPEERKGGEGPGGPDLKGPLA